MSSILLPVFLYILIMTGTPGPNNMMLTASGARFGFRRTLPLVFGIHVGVFSMLAAAALGLAALFERFPGIQQILKVVGSGYLLYLAVKIAFSGSSDLKRGTEGKPLRLWHGAVFQYVNPKAYVMAITAMSIYPLPGSQFLPSAGIIMVMFAVVGIPVVSLWAGFGTLLARVVEKSRYRWVVSTVLAGLTALSVVFIWI